MMFLRALYELRFVEAAGFLLKDAGDAVLYASNTDSKLFRATTPNM